MFASSGAWGGLTLFEYKSTKDTEEGVIQLLYNSVMCMFRSLTGATKQAASSLLSKFLVNAVATHARRASNAVRWEPANAHGVAAIPNGSVADLPENPIANMVPATVAVHTIELLVVSAPASHRMLSCQVLHVHGGVASHTAARLTLMHGQQPFDMLLLKTKHRTTLRKAIGTSTQTTACTGAGLNHKKFVAAKLVCA